MDDYTNYNYNDNQDAPKKNRDIAANISLFLSIVAVIGSSTIFMGVISGIAAIAAGIISRVHRGNFSLNSILGIVIGGIAILLSCVVFLGVIMMINENPEIISQFMQTYYQ